MAKLDELIEIDAHKMDAMDNLDLEYSDSWLIRAICYIGGIVVALVIASLFSATLSGALTDASDSVVAFIAASLRGN